VVARLRFIYFSREVIWQENLFLFGYKAAQSVYDGSSSNDTGDPCEVMASKLFKKAAPVEIFTSAHESNAFAQILTAR